MDTVGHIPVLPRETLELLSPKAGETCLDCTLGRGGHAASIIPLLGPGGRYIGLDMDAGNRSYAAERLEPIAAEHGVELVTVHQNFAGADGVLRDLCVEAVDMLLADLGFASNQLDDPGRGLSFAEDGPLDMRLDPSQPMSAAELVATLGQADLADVIYRYGEERMSRKIAAKIVAARGVEPIETTRQLAELVRSAVGPGGRRQRIDPATRTFMALRIAVNGELASLERLLEGLPGLLGLGGRAAIISFHSLEDRPVKQRFASLAQGDGFERLTRKPVTADDEESSSNPRSRSAKLRAIRRLS